VFGQCLFVIELLPIFHLLSHAAYIIYVSWFVVDTLPSEVMITTVESVEKIAGTAVSGRGVVRSGSSATLENNWIR
jgi:hypothetical protein